jgi:hypothetical protein
MLMFAAGFLLYAWRNRNARDPGADQGAADSFPPKTMTGQ